MVTRTRWAVLVAAALLLTTVSLPASAAPGAAPNRFVSGWVPYWMSTTGGATVTSASASPLVSDLSLFGSSNGLTSLAAKAHAAGLPVFQTLFSASTAGFMTDAARTATIDAIVRGVGSYDGVDIDYEFVWSVNKKDWPTIQPQWVLFIKALSNSLHARGKLLSVTVPPVWNGGANGYTVYAQPLIAPFVDRLRLMVYDWSISRPGPIAPDFWVKSVIAYSTTTAKVPPKKLQLGVPAYGRHWTTKKVSTQVCPDGALKPVDSITMRETAALRAAHSAVATRSFGEITFGWDETVRGLSRRPPPYVPVARGVSSDDVPAPITGMVPATRLGVPRMVSCTVRHTVYVPDANTITNSAKSALASGFSGISLWTFGYETPDLFDAQHLGAVAPQRASGPPAVALDPVTRTTTTITVAGTAHNPAFDLPVPVQITFLQADGTPVGVATNALANGAVTMPAPLAAIGPFHGFSRVAAIPAGATSVCVTQLAWGGVPIAATKQCAAVPAA